MASISTRFLIISDTHGFQFGDAERCDGSFRQPVPKVDVLLHCGDLTECGGIPAYQGVLRMLGSIDAELKLVIAGNHDLDLDTPKDDIPEDHEDHAKAVELMTGPLAEKAVSHIFTKV
jgi:predicted phosphodiesterase